MNIPPCPKCGQGSPVVQFLKEENKLVCTHCGIMGTPERHEGTAEDIEARIREEKRKAGRIFFPEAQ